jgi:flagellar motor switch protein FliM
VQRLDVEYLNSEINPHFANIVSPTEIVVVTTFHVELDGGGGDIHVTMPYSMIEPMRELLDAGVASDRVEHDERCLQALKEEIEDAEVELSMILGRGSVSVEELVNLKPGDVIPIDFNGRATVIAEEVPIFRGMYGVSHGMHALKIDERIMRHKPKILDALMGPAGVN